VLCVGTIKQAESAQRIDRRRRELEALLHSRPTLQATGRAPRAATGRARPQRIFADQGTEAVSERSFSTAGMYASSLRHCLGAKVASTIVKCNKNHDWLFDKIKDKIKDHYFRKFRNTAGAFDEANPDFEDE